MGFNDNKSETKTIKSENEKVIIGAQISFQSWKLMKKRFGEKNIIPLQILLSTCNLIWTRLFHPVSLKSIFFQILIFSFTKNFFTLLLSLKKS